MADASWLTPHGSKDDASAQRESRSRPVHFPRPPGFPVIARFMIVDRTPRYLDGRPSMTIKSLT